MIYMASGPVMCGVLWALSREKIFKIADREELFSQLREEL